MLAQFKAMIVSMFMAFNFGASQPAINIDNIDNLKEVACLSQAVHAEASNQPMEGKIAVAYVIINRTKSSNFPDDVCAVVKQKGQFTFKPVWIKENVPGVKKQMEDSIRASMAAWEGSKADPTHGALYFVNPKTYTNREWLRGFRLVTRIGDHNFYKPKRTDM
jgi:N-acetylmuramoyl-L-alanine amidase